LKEGGAYSRKKNRTECYPGSHSKRAEAKQWERSKVLIGKSLVTSRVSGEKRSRTKGRKRRLNGEITSQAGGQSYKEKGESESKRKAKGRGDADPDAKMQSRVAGPRVNWRREKRDLPRTLRMRV